MSASLMFLFILIIALVTIGLIALAISQAQAARYWRSYENYLRVCESHRGVVSPDLSEYVKEKYNLK